MSLLPNFVGPSQQSLISLIDADRRASAFNCSLGSKYTWRGPFPEGDRFRPRAEGIPSQLSYPPVPRL